MKRTRMASAGRTTNPVIILGMHRSGTSYLASFVGAWGVNLGQRLLDPSAVNRRGFFEDRDFVEFHARIMNRVLPRVFPGGELGNFFVTGKCRIEPDEAERAEAERIIASRSQTDRWGWKDPRTCLLLDFWRNRFPQATLIAIYRHPLEVYASLIRRKDHSVLYNEEVLIETWAAYNSAILKAWRLHRGPKLLVGGGDILRRPAKLAALLKPLLGPPQAGYSEWPEFHKEEFQQLPIDVGVHACFRRLFPAAAGIFDRLQKAAESPLRLSKSSERRWKAMATFADTTDAGVRGLLLPVMASVLSKAFQERRHWFLRRSANHLVNLRQRTRELSEEVTRMRAERSVLAEELTVWRASFLADAVPADHRHRHLYIWGWNALGRRVFSLLEQRNIRLKGIIDRASSEAMTPEIALAGFRPQSDTPPFVIVCSRSSREEIVSELATAGLYPPHSVAALPINP